MAAADDLTGSYMARVRDLADLAAASIARAWDELGSWDEADIERLARTAGPALEVYAFRAGAVSVAYLSRLLRETPRSATGVAAPDWRGPFTHYWGGLANGMTADEALAAGRARAEASAARSVVSTARRAGDVYGDRVTGWRRTLSADPCEWCISVAGQDYATASSADFGHDRCHCGVSPILA